MGPDWSFPVTRLGPPNTDDDWVHQIAPLYATLVDLVHPILLTGDPIARRQWAHAKAALDQAGEPVTREEANQRWRRCVVQTWKLVLDRDARLAAQAAARSARNRPGLTALRAVLQHASCDG